MEKTQVLPGNTFGVSHFAAAPMTDNFVSTNLRICGQGTPKTVHLSKTPPAEQYSTNAKAAPKDEAAIYTGVTAAYPAPPVVRVALPLRLTLPGQAVKLKLQSQNCHVLRPVPLRAVCFVFYIREFSVWSQLCAESIT